MSGGEAEAFDVGALAVDGSEIGEREVDFGGGNGVASVSEHLKRSLAREVVSVALGAAFVHIAAEAPAEFLPSGLTLVPISVHLSLSQCNSLSLTFCPVWVWASVSEPRVLNFGESLRSNDSSWKKVQIRPAFF